MAEVVGLRSGTPVAHPGNPDERVIEAIKWLLERAEAGEITGVAYAAFHFDGSTTHYHTGRLSRALVGALFSETNRVSRIVDEA